MDHSCEIYRGENNNFCYNLFFFIKTKEGTFYRFAVLLGIKDTTNMIGGVMDLENNKMVQ